MRKNRASIQDLRNPLSPLMFTPVSSIFGKFIGSVYFLLNLLHVKSFWIYYYCTVFWKILRFKNKNNVATVILNFKM